LKTLLRKNKTLKPLVKWSGGKHREISNFDEFFPDNFSTYIEPFVGGGAVFFGLAPQKNVISDVHEGLINFYKQISLGNSCKIYDRLMKLEVSEKSYYEIRDRFEIEDDVDKAVRFYYLRKTAFRGMLRYNKSGKFNIPWGRYKNVSFEDLNNQEYTDLLKRTDVRLCSFESIFEEFDSSENFVFMDPPYDSKFTDYGYCKFGKDYQYKLSDVFKKSKNKCLMVIGRTELIDDLYKDYIVGSYHKKYSFRIHSGRVGSEINNDHVIIKNY
jgi:DNA adenine methylase